ncbi:MAG TPA: HAD family hydrolase, partial [Spirochaetia bacterium]|nr:HAD family hydrolase [Spirochaetia bacterium]
MHSEGHNFLRLQKERDFFIGIDSDGCMFDTMEVKHKECFCPQTILCFRLQPVSKYAREAWEFVNLYSVTRGTNRYLSLQTTMELLAARPEVTRRGAVLPDLQSLRVWTRAESKLGEPALRAYVAHGGDAALKAVLTWSEAVNTAIREMVVGVPPFPLARESIAESMNRADLMVVSQTPHEALVREWREHELDRYVRLLAGQEQGAKRDHLEVAVAAGYAPERMLMIGDAPGDLSAARDNGMLFFPVIPGREIESWERFYHEARGRFFAGTFAGSYQESLLQEFTA